MPRRNANVKRPVASKAGRARPKGRPRGAYRPEAQDALDRIEEKRLRLGVPLADLAARTGLSERSIQRMRKDGRAFPRHLRALGFALRTIERERAAEDLAL